MFSVRIDAGFDLQGSVYKALLGKLKHHEFAVMRGVAPGGHHADEIILASRSEGCSNRNSAWVSPGKVATT